MDSTDAQAPLTGAEILIVEDSGVQAAVLRKMFREHGYEVSVAPNGQEALGAVRRRRPAVIVSDVVMPVMNGYAFCRTLKNDPALRDIPVILLTSLSGMEDILSGLEAKADYYLTKPQDAQADHQYLLETVQAALNSPPSELHEEPTAAMELTRKGKSYVVTAGRRQMLDLLLATCENAVQQNRELIKTQHELQALNAQLQAQQRRIEEQQRALEEANARLQERATHDGLTGVKNRQAFEERLTEEFGRARRYNLPLSLILLDVDRFKSYNDSFGHPAGDEVLRSLAQVLQSESRELDLVARYGGEEFAVLLPSTDQQSSKVLAERLRAAVEVAPWKERPVTASFGVATLIPETTDTASLIQEADDALYASKANGRNRVTHALELEGS